MSTQLEEQVDLESNLGEPKFAHIVEATENTSAHARITEAMVNGTPITALCGFTWVPSRSPNQYPVCPKCLEIFEFAKDLRS